MCEIIINGGRRLNGELEGQGSKNAVLPILAATVLTDDQCVIHNCPDITDVSSASEILKLLGCRVSINDNTAIISAKDICGASVPKELMKQMRSSVMFMGAMLARCGEIVLCEPGGCKLGERPIDIHIKALIQLGAEITQSNDKIFCRLDHISPKDVTLIYPSVGATENIMLMCAGRKCDIKIYNPAREPEIVELQTFLNKMGAKIWGAGTDVIRIQGVNVLHGCEHTVVPDRIVAATYACMTTACGGDVHIKDVPMEHIRTVLSVLEGCGSEIICYGDGVRIKMSKRPKGVGKIKTLPYPWFPTDVQPMLCAVLCIADGNSSIDEAIFENRFGYVPELIKMGADIKKNNLCIDIKGREKLYGARIKALDLRSGAALVTAALSAEGQSVLSGVNYIDRGYEKIEENLKNLSADIKRCNGENNLSG